MNTHSLEAEFTTEGELMMKTLPEALVVDPERRRGEIRYLQSLVNHTLPPEDLPGLDRILAREDNTVFLCFCRGDRIVGMIQGTRIDNLIHSKVFVDSVAVHGDLQGLGYGKVMLQQFEAWVLEVWPSVNKIILSSSERRGTMPFYTGLGYVPRADLRPLVRWAKRVANLFSDQPDESYLYQKTVR